MSKTKTKTARLIVAASETDPDMLYATRFFAPDPFVFLQQNGKRTLVLSDMEMGRGRRQATADEFVSFNKLEREVQGSAKKAAAHRPVQWPAVCGAYICSRLNRLFWPGSVRVIAHRD